MIIWTVAAAVCVAALAAVFLTADRFKYGRLLSPFTAVRTLWDAILKCDRDLEPDEEASTPFRFFRSNHVRDLRLIIAWTAIMVLLFAIIILVHADSEKHPFTYSIERISPALAVFGAVVAWGYLSASARLGIVDLVASEIMTLSRVGTAFDVGLRYVGLYDKPDDLPKNHSESKEEYFTFLQNNSKDLQVLESTVVNHIIAFYTYMKATRDIRRTLNDLETSDVPDSRRKLVICDLIYSLFLGYERARKAIHELVEYEPTRTENKMIILITELTCYRFLLDYFKDDLKDDRLRYSRLYSRIDEYDQEVKKLCYDATKGYKDSSQTDNQWHQAYLTIFALKKRFENVLDNKPIYDDVYRKVRNPT
jgi:hypothetical protein